MIRVNEQDRQVLAELGGELPAGSAGRMSARGRDSERLKASMTRGDGGAERNPFSADRQAVRRVLDVAAADDFAGFGQQRGSD